MSLQKKFVLFGFVSAVLPLLLLVFLNMRLTSQFMSSQLESQAQTALLETNNLIKNRIDPIFSYSYLVIGNPVLSLALKEGNGKVLRNLSQTIQKGLGLDILEVCDMDGKLVYSIEDEKNPLSAGFSRPVVVDLYKKYRRDRTLSVAVMERKPRGIAVQVATVLADDNAYRINGSALMGFYLNQSFLKGIQSVIQAQFILFSRDERFEESLGKN